MYLGIVIILVILVTGTFTFYQNNKSEAIMAKFKDFIPPKADAIRNGKNAVVDAVTLVPGDIITVSTGNKIPADIRIITANEMKVDNSSLTVSSFARRVT
jgi:sodium/potassium-transporting ATPase subunit alpha